MDNVTFAMQGAFNFFDRYPVADLNPFVENIPYGTLDWQVIKLRAKLAGTPAGVNTKRVDHLRIGYSDHKMYGRPANADELQVVRQDNRINFFDVHPKGNTGSHHNIADVDCPLDSKAPVTIRLRTDRTPTCIPLFYLPYDLNRQRRITLNDKQAIGNVNFFITDIVDGCSVFVEGTRQTPTVSHINANREHIPGHTDLPPKTQPAARKNDWKHKADHMNQRFRNVAPPKRVANLEPGLVAERRADYKHYGFRVLTDETAFTGSLAALQATNRAPNTIAGQAVASMDLIHAAGTIFGARNAGNWTFYVQKRALVTYLDAAHNVLGNQWLIRSVDQFWPALGATTGKGV